MRFALFVLAVSADLDSVLKRLHADGEIGYSAFAELKDHVQNSRRKLADDKGKKPSSQCMAQQMAKCAMAMGDISCSRTYVELYNMQKDACKNTSNLVELAKTVKYNADHVAEVESRPWCKSDITHSAPAGQWFWQPMISGQSQYGRCQYAAPDDAKSFQKRDCVAKKGKDGKLAAVWGAVDTTGCPWSPCASLSDDIGSAIEVGDCQRNVPSGKTCNIECNEGKYKGQKGEYKCPNNNTDPDQQPVGKPPKCLYPCEGGLPWELAKNSKADEECKSVEYGDSCKVRCTGDFEGETLLRCHKDNENKITKLSGKKLNCEFGFLYKASNLPLKGVDPESAKNIEKFLTARGWGGKTWKGCYGWEKQVNCGGSCASHYHKGGLGNSGCDKKGPVLVIVWLKNGQIIGAFKADGEARAGNGRYDKGPNHAKNFVYRAKSIVGSRSGGVNSWGGCTAPHCDYYNQGYGPTLGGGHDFSMYGTNWATGYANPSSYQYRRTNSYYLNEVTNTTHFGPGQANGMTRWVAYIQQ